MKLGKWCEARQKDYIKLLVRVQQMIVGVTLAEKEGRANDRTIQKALLGYDPEKWVKTDVEIRGEEQIEVGYQSINSSNPPKGKHRFAHCQVLYMRKCTRSSRKENGRWHRSIRK